METTTVTPKYRSKKYLEKCFVYSVSKQLHKSEHTKTCFKKKRQHEGRCNIPNKKCRTTGRPTILSFFVFWACRHAKKIGIHANMPKKLAFMPACRIRHEKIGIHAGMPKKLAFMPACQIWHEKIGIHAGMPKKLVFMPACRKNWHSCQYAGYSIDFFELLVLIKIWMCAEKIGIHAGMPKKLAFMPACQKIRHSCRHAGSGIDPANSYVLQEWTSQNVMWE